MKSNDFKKLSDLLSKQHYRIESLGFKFEKISESSESRKISTLTMKKSGKEIVFESSEEDVNKFADSLERAISINGEIEFARYHDMDKYRREEKYLFDENNQKRQDVHQKLESGEFIFSYDPEELLIEFLNSKNPFAKHFEPLKTDYFEIRAHYLRINQTILNQIDKMKIEKPKLDKSCRMVDEILVKAYQYDRNFLLNFKKFSNSIDVDINDLIFQIKRENDFKEQYKKMLAKNSPIDGEIGIKFLLDFYRRTSEQSVPFINALRISIEKIEGKTNPAKKLSYVKNCEIIRSKSEYSYLVECIDPHIRHSESHMNTIIDSKSHKVIFTSTLGKQREKIREYTFEQIADMTLKLENEIFLAFPLGFFYARLALIDIILLSQEYRVLLLSINNRKLPY